MEKVKIPRCWLHYVNWTLLAVLLIFCLFDQILYGFRSPEAGLPITRKPLLGFQSFIWLSEDASGHMYALGGGSKVVRLGIDGDSTQYYHLDMFKNPMFNVAGDVIQVFDNGTMYEYDADGNFLQKYPADSGSWLPVLDPITRDGKEYVLGWSGTDWIIRIEAFDLSVDAAPETVLWTFSLHAKKRIIQILWYPFLLTCIALLFRHKAYKAAMRAQD